MRNLLPWVFVASLLLGACNLPSSRTPQPADVATRVSQLLTVHPNTETPMVLSTVPVEIPTISSNTITPTITIVPLATAALSADDPRSSLGSPTWSDRFDGNPHFGVFTDENVRVEQKDHSLVMTALQPNGWHSWTMSSPTLDNFYLEATTTTSTCSGKDRYGLFFRAPDPNQGYFLSFTCEGNFAIRKWDGSAFTDLLISSSPSAAINPGGNQTNRIGIKAVNHSLTIFANGVNIGETQDTSISQGTFGLLIAAYATQNFTVKVTEVDYWDLP